MKKYNNLSVQKHLLNMKAIFLLLITTMVFSFEASAQSNIQLKVEWNIEKSRYEVFAVSQTAMSNLSLKDAQISVVVPWTAVNQKLLVTSQAGGTWSEALNLYSPGATPEKDYHAIKTSGGTINLVANNELMLFSFKFSNGECLAGVRLYNNGADPTAGAVGFGLNNFSNSILSSTNIQMYQVNYSNSGTMCSECPVVFKLPQLTPKSN